MTKSEICAEHDGIKWEYINHWKYYHIPCTQCGSIIKRRQYASDKVYLCDYCKLALKEKQKSAQLQELMATKSRKEILFDKAVEEISNQVDDMAEYQKPIQFALTKVERYGSIPEMMVAIELLRLRYAIIPQQKVGEYKVDFAIPSIKRVVEVDGSIYHTNKLESLRDAKIKLMLGTGWNIIHIPAELIRKHIRTLESVIASSMCNTSKKNK